MSSIDDRKSPLAKVNASGLLPPFTAVLMLASGVGLMILQPTLFPVSSGIFSGGIACFIHLFLGNLDQSQLDIDAESDSSFAQVGKLALKGKFSGAIGAFFVIWLILNGLQHLQFKRDARENPQTRDQQLEELIGQYKEENELETLHLSIDSENNRDGAFPIKMNNVELGIVTHDDLHISLKELAQSAAKLRKKSKLTNEFLKECSSILGVCKQPFEIPVKVSFGVGLGKDQVLICPRSRIHSFLKISGKGIVVSKSIGSNEKIIKIVAENINTYDGPSPCKEGVSDWVQVAMAHRTIFGSDDNGIVDAFLFLQK